MMKRAGRHNALVYGLYANAVLLAAVLVVLLGRDPAPGPSPAWAQQPPIAGGAGVFVMPAQLSSNLWGAYLMDVDAQTISVYQFFPHENELRLMAARSFRHDRRLGNFNTSPPPSEIADLVEKEQQTGRVLESPPADSE